LPSRRYSQLHFTTFEYIKYEFLFHMSLALFSHATFFGVNDSQSFCEWIKYGCENNMNVLEVCMSLKNYKIVVFYLNGNVLFSGKTFFHLFISDMLLKNSNTCSHQKNFIIIFSFTWTLCVISHKVFTLTLFFIKINSQFSNNNFRMEKEKLFYFISWWKFITTFSLQFMHTQTYDVESFMIKVEQCEIFQSDCTVHADIKGF
jgi:hypothetical protein